MRVKILTHNSGEFETVVDASFNPVDIGEKLNDNTLNTILIGNINIARIEVKMVIPLAE